MKDVPKAGRYRLFRWSGQRLQCRVCFRRVKVDHQWQHLATEIRNAGSEAALAELLRFRSMSRRSKRNLSRARYEYAVGRGRDRT